MQILRNLKHISFIWLIGLFIIIGSVRLFGNEFLLPVTHFFVYRETGWVNYLYPYAFLPSKDIVLVKIDDNSLNKYQQNSNIKMLTISKARYASLVRLIESGGAKGIAFDIIFQNADPTEQQFIDTLSNYKNIVIASSYEPNAQCSISTQSRENEVCEGTPRKLYSDVPWGLINNGISGDRRPFVVNIKDKAYADWKAEKDIYTLPLALANILNIPYERSRYEGYYGENFLIPFFGGENTYNNKDNKNTYGFDDVLSMNSGELMEAFSGKYVFIGEGGSILHDQYISPVTGKMMDGVDSHAHLFDGILQGRYLTEFTLGNTWYFMGISILTFFAIVFTLWLPKYISPFVTLILISIFIAISRYIYFQYGYVLEIVPLLFAGGVITYPITYIYRFFIIDREKRIITSAFSHYVDGRVVEEIAESGKPINLGGESRRLSILFSDIAGFTTLSEKLQPEILFDLMSSYLSRMTDVLTKNGGTLDKYIGDAVMGFYGAPLVHDHHAIDACETALKMREALPAFNNEILSRGLDPIDFRVGIATGEVLVGNIGSHDRFNYTVLGDTVNLASRLEGASKEYGTHIIVSEGTYSDAREDYIFRKLDKIAVKGKTEGVYIYELIAKKDGKPFHDGIIREYEFGLEKYFSGDYLEAGKIFEVNAKIDPPSKALALRCLDILEGRLKIENGIYRMENK